MKKRYEFYEDVDGRTHRRCSESFIIKDIQTTKNRISFKQAEMKHFYENSAINLEGINKEDCHDLVDAMFDKEFNVLDPGHCMGHRINLAAYETVVNILSKAFNTMKDYSANSLMLRLYTIDIEQLEKHYNYGMVVLGIMNKEEMDYGTSVCNKD